MNADSPAAGDAGIARLVAAADASPHALEVRTGPGDGGDHRDSLIEVRYCDGDPATTVTIGILLGDGLSGREAALLAAATLLHRRPAPTISPREREVLALLATGSTSAGIAHELGIAAPTVQKHVMSLKRKLGATTRAEIVAIAARDGHLA